MSYAMQGYRGLGLVGTPISGQDVIDLDRAITTLFADVNRAVATSAPADISKLLFFQADYIDFYARWKAWYAKNQETWVSMGQKIFTPIIGIVLSERQDQEFLAFRGEYTTRFATWTQTLGQKTDAEQSGAAAGIPSWVWPVGATVLILAAAGYFLSGIPVRFHVGRR